ncbi:hypothetical protein LIER_34558 [Lithospermum erythrorhizon]|uniref:Uncharacterized protein n=1 Tax=Lithospermum erythrorhizon TaxID=34254 RepID=A0AAV3S266_LITER
MGRGIGDWMISSDPGGGPEDCDLIYGFGHHCAKKIWENADSHDVLFCHTRKNALKWFNPHELPQTERDWFIPVMASGLSHLHEITFPRHNSALIIAFVERWQPETFIPHSIR